MIARKCWAASLLLACLVAHAQMPVADLILTHARVRTQDSAQPEAEAVVIQNGRIVYVGSAQNAEVYRGAETRRILTASGSLRPCCSRLRLLQSSRITRDSSRDFRPSAR